MSVSSPSNYLELPALSRADKLPHGTCVDCKSVLNVGIFFDGTDNNRDRDKPALGHSNVARLYDAYKDNPTSGYFRYYVAGIGTVFDGISEVQPSFRGSPFGAGGEARIVHGLLQVLNALHAFVNNERPMFDDKQVKALCGDRWVARPNPNEWPPAEVPKEDQILTDLGLASGLVGNAGLRRSFLMKSAGKLSAQLALKKTSPNMSGVYLDVFGFSRGAAQARVFCTWLHEILLVNGKLCGVPAYVRFLGLFDTVASVGLNKTGHYDWATIENLHIHPDVKCCVHYVALHEFRNNFPSDSVYKNGVLPSNCCEQIAAGCHSDVGGGYEPGEQGKGVVLVATDPSNPTKFTPTKESGDPNKLSQLPLNLMLDAARKTREAHGADGDPWLDLTSEIGLGRDLPMQFKCDPGIRTAVERYFAASGVATGIQLEQAMREHMTLYVAFRYVVTQQKNGFQQLPSFKYAQTTDAKANFYTEGQEIFSEQLKALDRMVGVLRDSTENDFESKGYHSKAGVIYKKVKTMKVVADVGLFFDRYVHDSYAGFIGKFGTGIFSGLTHGIAEPRQYFCYRYMYQGDNTRLNALLEQRQSELMMA